MLLGYTIFDKSLGSIDFDKYKIINTINPHSYCLSRYDKLFYEALQSSDILLPDGTGIVLASKILNKQSIKKNCRRRYTPTFITASKFKKPKSVLFGCCSKYPFNNRG